MVRSRMITVYSIAHFAVDFACAFLVLRSLSLLPEKQDALLLYNFCAFALQLPFGVLTDRFGNGRLFSAAGCLIIALSAFFGSYPFVLCASAGIGNALFHIGGGHDILSADEKKAGPLGIFVSPGALGLFAGTLLSGTAAGIWPVSLIMGACVFLILLFCPRVRTAAPSGGRDGARRGPLVLGLLFLAVCVRSYGGFLLTYSWKSGLWAWVFVLCVALGKTAGGFLYDALGGRKAALVSLLPCALAFLGADRPALGCLAVLLFNMTMPVTLRGAADAVRGMPGFSFGLLTLALFVGFIPVHAGLPAPGGNLFSAALALASLAMLLPVFGRRPA